MITNPFKKPTAEQLAKRELEEAKRDLLLAESWVEYWESKRDMLTKRIERLEKMK